MDQIAAMATLTYDQNERELTQIMFMTNEGTIISDALINHTHLPVTMEWQPNGRLLAVGWADGMVSSWIYDGRAGSRPIASFSNSSQHSAAVQVIKWSHTGKRIVSGDKKGQVCVWSVDVRGTWTPLRQYRKKGEVVSAVFCVLPIRLDYMQRKDAKQIPVNTQNQSPAFFFGTDKGTVAYADDLGHCTDVQQLASAIDTMLFFEERSRLVIITRSLMLTQYQVADDGKVTRIMQMKLSVQQMEGISEHAEKHRGIKNVVWTCPGLVAAATHEKMLRLLDLTSDESYNLTLSALGEMYDRNDRIIAVAFGPLDRYLAVGTEKGVVAIWRYNGPIRDVTSNAKAPVASTSASDWELQYKTNLGSPVFQVMWHAGRGTIAAVTDEKVWVLSETVMQNSKKGDLAITQRDNTSVAVHVGGPQDHWVEDTSIVIRGLSVSNSCFAVWSGKQARVYRVDSQIRNIEALEPFNSRGTAMAVSDATSIADEALFICDNNAVKVTNFAGVTRATVPFTESEGLPQFIDINDKYLAVVTNKGIVKILDVHTPTKPKLLGSAGRFYDLNTGQAVGPSSIVMNSAAATLTGELENRPNSVLSVRLIGVNCDGTRVAIIADHVEGTLQVRHADSRLHVFDRNKGGVYTHDFARSGRVPVSISWDSADDRILCCETVRSRNPSVTAMASLGDNESGTNKARSVSADDPPAQSDIDGDAPSEIVIFFATTENGLVMQDSFAPKETFGTLLCIAVPRIFFRSAIAKQEESISYTENELRELNKARVLSTIMRDFVGMDDLDSNPSARMALLDFSFNLTLGKLDEAYRCIKAIDSPAVWENMAQMCVKTKRLDVAEVCLGNMSHARGAAALRDSRKEDSAEVSAAVLAIQLGLNDEAAKLYRDAGRYDLLNKLYQSAGLWDRAIKVANQYDRIHLKTTHYAYAKYLESVGDIEGAIENYELSECARTEVPRMLFDIGRMDDLEDYVHRSEDGALLKWWAAYLESTERYDKASKYYRQSGDYLSLIRIACFKEDYESAREIISDYGDTAAAYHFARQLETQGDYEGAIMYFAEAGCYNHSIRLARAYGLDGDLMRYALLSTPSLMLDCAAHFESKGEYDKAVQLYHKGGDLPRALDLCFRASEAGSSKSSGIYDMLNTIAQDLGAETSPQTLARCAEFLVSHKQFERAVELYVMAKRYMPAVEMCLQQRVTINEEMASTLSPPETMDPSERKEVLKNLAKALKKQGSFTLASKKFTQAGDRVKAIKCLVRSGDTKAVIQFAQISRNAEIYTLAANYLQQMNWRESVDIMKAIINFYTRAKAYEQLAGFYDSCAQVEIDDYRDYEKAVGALKEALKHLTKANTRSAQDMSELIDKRISLIEKYVAAKNMSKTDPEKMVRIIEILFCMKYHMEHC
jgi:intraflagellar transport protein 140